MKDNGLKFKKNGLTSTALAANLLLGKMTFVILSCSSNPNGYVFQHENSKTENQYPRRRTKDGSLLGIDMVCLLFYDMFVVRACEKDGRSVRID
jgi:hypothetical protein